MDEEGVEINYSKHYLGRTDIPIENLTISTKVGLAIIPFKVTGLARAMKQRFDPSQISLTVVPSDISTEFTLENIATRKYEVIHGRHRLVLVISLNSEYNIGLV